MGLIIENTYEESDACKDALKFLSETAVTFSSGFADREIYAFVANCILQLNPDAHIFVSSIDLPGNVVRTEALATSSRNLLKVISLLGFHPEGREYVVDNLPDEIPANRLGRFRSGIFGLSFGLVPGKTVRKKVALLAIGDMFGMSIVVDNIPRACVVIMLPKRNKLRHPELIEAFLHQASIAFKQRVCDDLAGNQSIEKVLQTQQMLDEKHKQLSVILSEVVALVGDITGKMPQENRAHLTEKKFRALANSISDVFFAFDHELKYVFWNKASVNLTGIQINDAIGKSLRDLFGWMSNIDEIESFYRQVMASKKTMTRVFVNDASGEPRFTEIRAYPTEVGVSAIARDITERLKAEEQLKRREAELKKLIASKDRLFSVIAHDLRGPLSTIMGFSELMGERLKSGSLNGFEKMVLAIQRSSQHTFELLTNLLEWSRLQIGRSAFSPELIDISELVNECISFSRETALSKGIRVRASLSERQYIKCDREMISSVLRNLLINAIKFSHPEGTVLVDLQVEANELIVAVQDQGTGISAGNAEKLFRIDEKVSTPGTANEKGTGLGLIISKEFIGKHSGRIWFESEEGRGSTFYFSLPVLETSKPIGKAQVRQG
jgi:PAS domain S-box-containing protein